MYLLLYAQSGDIVTGVKLRCAFITDRKHVAVPDGWEIVRIETTTPPRGKPQFMILFSHKEKPRIGFSTSQAKRKSGTRKRA